MAFLIVDDLLAFASDIDRVKAQAMIDDASSMAVLVAPCLGAMPTTLTLADLGALKAILRQAIIRWNESGSGALSAQTAGPFGQTLDTRQSRKSMFYPSEIAQLQSLCSTSSSSYTLSLAGPDPLPGVPGWV